MTLLETIDSRMTAIRMSRNVAPIGIVVGNDIYGDLISHSAIQTMYVNTVEGYHEYSYETYRGLELSISQRPGTLVIY